MNKSSSASDATLSVHAGEDRHGHNAPITTEIQQTAVFALKDTEQLRRYAAGDPEVFLYTRYGNPTLRAAEEKIAALEHGEDCILTASGLAAELAVALTLCKSGDEIVSMLDIYGGTTKLFSNLLARCGIKTRFVPFTELSNIDSYFTRKTRMLFLETPTNPTLRCADIQSLSVRAHKRKIAVVVDNTFATPILQKPLSLGADIVVHSATKYLGGHSDLTAGAVITTRRWADPIRNTMILSGGCSDPGVAYLLLRGLKTLEIRVARACHNARVISEYLAGHRQVDHVFYPGLPDSSSHQLAAAQMSDFGAIVSFDIRGGGVAAERFIDALKLWYLATSLGGVESTVSYPVLSSHSNATRRELKLLGVSPSTIRLSVGIENATDLIDDLEHAFANH
ncbi:MAG TPA: aminotransferase class I/II-fold pyridoxal phosphate-dependent enzyme [Candidatus Saccharimonadales bacterium]|nr:aminotransferase class I/II-fold pyridoxal phosphate-dependent enzyme [Candidatus Saccharimonadales bacterium]